MNKDTGLGDGHTDAHTYRHTNQNNFKKPEVHLPVASACLVYNNNLLVKISGAH